MHEIASLATLKLPAHRHHAAIVSIHSERQFSPVPSHLSHLITDLIHARYVRLFHIFIAIQAYISSKDKAKKEYMAL